MPFTQLPQEFIRRNEERVLLEDAADDLPAKLGEIVDSYDRVLIARQNIVQSRLVLHQIVDARPIFERPFHVRDHPGAREPLLPAPVEDLLDQSEHPILIEVTIT